MLPYFKRAEDNERGEDEYHGAGGPLPVSEGRSRNPLSQYFIDSATALGLPLNEDFNGAEQDGVGWYQVTHRNGARASAAVAYLHPVMSRPNLTVETHVHALSILVEGGRAVGVVGARLSDMIVHRAEREVIVCGGTYNSPQLLMLSGIGRPDELMELQIEPVAESPEMGLNLHDHPQSGAVYGISEEISLFGAFNEENLALFEAEGRGPLTSNVAEAGGFIRTRVDMEAPDIQLHFAPARFQSEGLVPGDGHGFAAGACVLKPKSRGFVVLGSPDPTAKPLIVHNYLQHEDDVASMVAGMRTCLEILEGGKLGELSTGMLIGPDSHSDEDIEAHCRQRLQTLYHPVGTCRMGSDRMSVVDRTLRVHGVDGLRVADASIMPAVVRGHTNATAIMIGERAAELVRAGVPRPEAEVAPIAG
jgi:choline dehydrogenase-like flavoprotein